MHEPAWTNLIAAIHASGRQAVIAVTGGGSLAIGRLLQVPGGSQSLLEAVVPYSQPALEEFLGGTPDQFCSEPTSRAMAMAAWMRAVKLGSKVNPCMLVGISATASLASDVPKRGEHRFHIAVQTADATKSYSLNLTKGLRDRASEEDLTAQLLLIALGESSGVDGMQLQERFQKQLASGETIVVHEQFADSGCAKLLLGEQACVRYGATNANSSLVFPGAFNPLHRGHIQMAEIASQRFGQQAAYELSVTNVDKPPLDFVEIDKRLSGLLSCDPKPLVLLTAAPTFREKATILPGSTFVVGIDTLLRIADPSYYHENVSQRDQAIQEIADAECRFLVFGRELGGEFCSLSDVDIPAALRELCEEVPVSEFREDVSSTELRKR